MPDPLIRFSARRSTSNRSSLSHSVRRLVNLRGGFNVAQVGASHSWWNDLYHLLLTLPWLHFIALLAVTYIALNVLFAFAYLVRGDSIANAQPGSFADAFFFSVQTMASIGYGAMHPSTVYAHVVVTIEAIVGLFWLAIATGLMFARFSRPTAKVLFSNVAVVAPRDGVPTLMLRMANQRGNQILEAQLRLTLVRNVITAEGEFMRRFYDLELERSQTPIFALTWLAMHPIQPTSPLYAMTSEDLAEVDAEVIVTLSGVDETFSQTIHTRHSYIPSEVFWNMRFEDILTTNAEGRRVVDYRHFHTIKPVA